MNRFLDWASMAAYKTYVRLSYYRYRDAARNYMEYAELDRLYEIEDFLRNTGETRRANDIGASRRMLKACFAYTYTLSEENNDLRDERQDV